MSKLINIYFSDVFDIEPSILKEYGAFNISLIMDLPLFIDPFLLFNSEKTQYVELHKNILTYVGFLRDMSLGEDLSDGLLKAWFYFPEIKQNWFGYSKHGNDGRGLGTVFAKSLNSNLHYLFSDFGKEPISKSSHLEKLCLIKDGVGRDNISDFTANLIKEYLLYFTQDFSSKYLHDSQKKSFNIEKVRFNYITRTWESGQFILPYYNDDFILLTPSDILTKDDTWINRGDLNNDYWEVIRSIDNDQLRESISHYLMEAIPPKAKQKDINFAISGAISTFPQLLDYYIKYKEDHAEDAKRVSDERLSFSNQAYVELIRELVYSLSDTTNFYKLEPTSFEAAYSRVQFLKDFIENKDGYKFFYVKGKPIEREEDLQLIYRLTWFGSEYSVDREVNNGRGAVDFKISKGALDASLVEFKLASNSHLANVFTQISIYEKANNTNSSIAVVIYFTISEKERVERLVKQFGLESSRGLVTIDAIPNKPSASTARSAEAIS
ncbi:MAG TPA: hypothetical protein VEW28_00670 [Candidatus Kapabacteria bacterium]|nr:hypothetical protein [Candidatus Kapabacteria bacterium]